MEALARPSVLAQELLLVGRSLALLLSLECFWPRELEVEAGLESVECVESRRWTVRAGEDALEVEAVEATVEVEVEAGCLGGSGELGRHLSTRVGASSG